MSWHELKIKRLLVDVFRTRHITSFIIANALHTCEYWRVPWNPQQRGVHHQRQPPPTATSPWQIYPDRSTRCDPHPLHHRHGKFPRSGQLTATPTTSHRVGSERKQLTNPTMQNGWNSMIGNQDCAVSRTGWFLRTVLHIIRISFLLSFELSSSICVVFSGVVTNDRWTMRLREVVGVGEGLAVERDCGLVDSIGQVDASTRIFHRLLFPLDAVATVLSHAGF